MGAYLNSQTPYTLYQSESRSPYFVDKTMLLQELFPYVAAGNRHLCVTRPRRFGKTIAANMISSFFQKGIDSGELFDRLKISEADDCQKYKNKYNVIRIDFSKMPRNCESYRQYIERVEELLISDLREAYPDAKTSETDAIGDILEEIFQQYHGEKFIFVLDEWDFIFHRGFITEADKAKYVAFLSNLLKDRPYVILSYMTGILPIAKYSSGSELNMFAEFTMVNSPMFGTYFGFTDDGFRMLAEDEINMSILAKIGSAIAWIFHPLGWGNWQAAVASITGLVAKENIVGTMGILYGGGELPVYGELALQFTKLAGFSFLTFNLLCAPCFAAIGAIKRETNSPKWTWAAIGYQCGFAYVVSLCIYNIGNLIAHGTVNFWTIVAFALVIGFLYLLFRPYKESDTLKVNVKKSAKA